MNKKLLLLSFIEGAAVMAAELCGAKLLAPIFGGSLYVWATVMGLTLAALAGGYFFGGWLAAKEKLQVNYLRLILSYAAIELLLMPIVAYYLVPRLSYMSFASGVLSSSFILLVPPVFLLGASSPLFILKQTKTLAEAGRVSGTVYAVSTLGGICATFLCGFYMVPELGLVITLVIFGLILFAATAIIFRSIRVPEILVVCFSFYLCFQILRNKAQFLESSDSILGKLEIFDEDRGGKKVRLLRINDIIQTEMDLSTHLSVSKYIALLDTLIPVSSNAANAVVLGLGGGLSANLLVNKNYKTIGVEFDARIAKSAQDYFLLDKSVVVEVTDARKFLNVTNEKYKVIVADLFKAEEQPSHVLTLESLTKLKTNLSDDGLLYISWHGYLDGKRGLGTAILLNTLKEAGYKTKVCSYSEEEDTRNLVIIAALNELATQPYQLKYSTELTALVNTDDRPCLEKYNADANKAWRTSYLRFYQHQ